LEESTWIKSLMQETKRVILLYGNIDDDYFYDNAFVSLAVVLDSIFKPTKRYFSFDDLTTEDVFGFKPTDGLNIIKDLSKEIDKNRNDCSIIIKNPSLFFSDISSNNSESFYSHSIHYFNEVLLNRDENFKIVFIAPKLESYPVQLYINNPEVSIINVEKPNIDERKLYIENFNILSNSQDNREFAKLCYDRSLKEISEIIAKATSSELDFTNYKKMISFYDFGVQDSPWTKLDNNDIINIDKKLKERVFGQDKAVNFVKRVLVRAKLGLSRVHQNNESSRPIGTFFFVGPTGVGKTELSKAITEAIFGDEKSFKRFDMSEYKDATSVNKLIGSSPGYVGFEQGGELTNWLRENPFSVILFDEIEKANPIIWDTFLQILEDGRLTDNKGKTVYFKESIIIFTSNIGSSDNNTTDKNRYINAVRNYFTNKLERVEILNRFGNNIVEFEDISGNEIYTEIIESKLNTTITNISEILNCKINIDNKYDLIQFLLKIITKSSDKFGGRAVINTIETYLVNEFGLFFIKSKPDSCEIYLENNTIKFRYVE